MSSALSDHLKKSRAFAVWFKDLRVWSVAGFRRIHWQWPDEYIGPLGSALTRRTDEVDRRERKLNELQLITIHFDGTLVARSSKPNNRFKGRLFFAESGDVVYSKIDVRNGAIAIVPKSIPNAVVSSEFPVYQVNREVALPAYIKLLFKTVYFRHAINGMISGASGRKRVQPEQLENLEVPFPMLSVQFAIVNAWESAQKEVQDAESALRRISNDLNAMIAERYFANQVTDLVTKRGIAVWWSSVSRWDLKAAKAAAFRTANPSFRPLREYAEEATELVRPWEQPEKEWPVYGVNNKEGVVFSHFQKGKEFKVPYKRISKDWFFHNPTRSSVGSLGIVPDVLPDSLTSPEYQVWRTDKDSYPVSWRS